LESEGIQLARERRDDLTDLIMSNPARALELQVPAAVRQSLPPAINALIERRVSGRGDLSVLASLAEPGHEGEVKPVFRIAQVGPQTYKAFVYGRRLGEPTRGNIALHGIAIDDLLAIDENPVRLLEPAEAKALNQTAPGAVCVVCGQAVSAYQDEPIVEVGGEIAYLCSARHADQLNQEHIAAEALGNPVQEDLKLIQAASAGTVGQKRLILIRVDFPDLTGSPFSDNTGILLISNLNVFYRECSYNKAGFVLEGAGSDITPVFRMTNNAAYYGTNDYFSKLRSEARAAANAAGYRLSNYNLDLICFGSVPGWSWAGLGYIGASGVWLRNSFSTGVAAHELGHNFGLNHANFWDTAGESVIGPGTSIEYGDKFDTMGSASAGQKHFNVRYKNYLFWLTGTEVRPFTTNGIYSIFPHDLTNVAGVRALRIARNSATNYWVEFRQKYTSNKWLMNGIGLRWAQSGNQSTLLLDTTPGSFDDKDDAAIVFGRTFSDVPAGIHITPLDTVGTNPVSVRVMVNRGSFPTNLPPTLSLAASATNVSSGALVNFLAAANDANGDALAYSWDFGDREFGTNTAATSHRWLTNGQFLVRCVVSDMKGGSASDSLVVRVGSPTTRIITGYVTADGKPLEGVRVFVSSSQSAFTDSDGTYKLVGLPNGTYTLNAKLAGYNFIHPGFTNPIQVRADIANFDFMALPPSGQTTALLIPAGAMWKYLDNGSNQGTAWYKTNFNDNLWKEGPAQLGYGDKDVTTVIGYGPDSNRKYITTYFRRAFLVDDPAQFAGLTLSVMRDDGAVVYLNGREVFRSNMPAGTISYSTLASDTVGGADESAFFDCEIDPARLVKGTNLVAVEVHQASASSSDLGFDLRLAGLSLSRTSPPLLLAERVGANIRLFWPATAIGWELYATADLMPPVAWTPVSRAIQYTNGQSSITFAPANSQQFFILKLEGSLR
jgi:hypothetical protein